MAFEYVMSLLLLSLSLDIFTELHEHGQLHSMSSGWNCIQQLVLTLDSLNMLSAG